LEKLAFVMYLVLLVAGPVLFGAVHTYAYTLVFIGVLFATLLVMFGRIQKDPLNGNLCFQFPLVGALLGISLGVAFCIFQLIPLPMEIVAWISPKAAFFHRMAVPDAVAEGSWASLAVYAYPVRQSLVRFSVYGLLFLGMIQVLNTRKRIETAAVVLLVMMALESLYGIYQTFAGGRHILWYRIMLKSPDVSGTYINRNHFAGLMEMGVILATCFSAAIPVRKQDSRTGSSFRRRWMDRLMPYLSGTHGGEKRILILFLGVVIGIGLILSASRGGMIAAAGGLFSLCILFLMQTAHRRKGYILLALVLIIAVYSSHIGVDYALGRFRDIEGGFETRYRYVRTALSLYADFPATGTGIGNFRHAYPRYQAIEDSRSFLDYPHNDWVQFLSEAGLAGMAILIAGLVCFLVDLGLNRKKRSHSWAVSMGAMPFGAVTAIAIHAYSDFNLHIPANFLVLSAVLAMGYAAACLEPSRNRTGYALTYRMIRCPLKGKGGVLLAVLIALTAWSGTWIVRHAIAEGLCRTVDNSTLNPELHPSVEKIRSAIAWDPWNAQYRFRLGLETNRQERDPDAEVRAFEQAVFLNPYNGDFHLRLGWAYAQSISDPADAWKWLALSDESMKRAAYCTGVNAPAQESLGNYWILRSKALPPDHPGSAIFKNKGFYHYDRAIGLLSGQDKKRAQDRIFRFAGKRE
jgi:O-antigen ligase